MNGQEEAYWRALLQAQQSAHNQQEHRYNELLRTQSLRTQSGYPFADMANAVHLREPDLDKMKKADARIVEPKLLIE